MCLELFNDEEEANNILKATDPFEMKRCGRKVRGFENDVWYKHCWNRQERSKGKGMPRAAIKV